MRYSKYGDGNPSGRIRWLGLNLSASPFGVSSVCMNIVLRDWIPVASRVCCAEIFGLRAGVCIARGCCCVILQTALDGRLLVEATSLTTFLASDFDDIVL